MFKVKYADSIMMLVRLNLNLIVSLFQHKCEVSETVSTTTLALGQISSSCYKQGKKCSAEFFGYQPNFHTKGKHFAW